MAEKRDIIGELGKLSELAREWAEYTEKVHGRNCRTYQEYGCYVRIFFGDSDYVSVGFEGVCGIEVVHCKSLGIKCRFDYVTIDVLERLPEIILSYECLLAHKWDEYHAKPEEDKAAERKARKEALEAELSALEEAEVAQ